MTNRHKVILGLGLGAGALFVLFVVGMTVLTWWWLQPPLPRLAPRSQESSEQKIQAFRSAFTGDPAPEDDPETVAVRQLFDSLGAALGKKDVEQVQACLDLDRLWQEVNRSGHLHTFGKRLETEWLQSLRQSFAAEWVRVLAPVVWTRLDIRRIERLDKDECVVTTRRWKDSSNGWSVKMRWWLRRHEDRWRIYDVEYLGVSFRWSDNLARGIEFWKHLERPEGVLIRVLFQGELLVSANKEMAQRILELLDVSQAPPAWWAQRNLARGLIAFAEGNFDEALTHFDRVETIQPDMHDLWLWRAISHIRLDHFDQAEACAREHLNRLGDDSVTFLQLGVALAGQEKNEEAAHYYRRGLDDDPTWGANAIGLWKVLPDGRKAELRDRFARIARLEDRASEYAAQGVADGETEGLAFLLAEWGKRKPNDPGVKYYTARLQVLLGQPEQAILSFREAWKQTEDKVEQAAYTMGFLNAMHEAGHALRAYETAPDSVEAFRLLAESLIINDHSTLDCLMAAHRQRQPDDVWLTFFAARLHQENLQFDEAEKAYAEGMKRDLDPETREQFRWHRVFTLVQAGRGLWAYMNVGPARETFAQVAELLSMDSVTLEQVVRMHRQSNPEDGNLPLWEAALLAQKKQCPEALALLMEKREVILARPENEWRYQSLLFRCLVRAGRYDDAFKEAKDNPFLKAVVHAVKGDVSATDEALSQSVEAGQDPRYFYLDEDLGPILRSEPFRELRAKYPEAPPDDPLP